MHNIHKLLNFYGLINVKQNTILFIFLLLLASKTSHAQYYVEYNKSIQKIYNSIIQLQFEEATYSLDSLRVEEPNNLALIHMDNYIDFFTIFIHERRDDFDTRKKAISNRIDKLDKLPKDDPYKRFLKAEILLQWSLLRAKFNELFRSSRDIFSAYKTLEDNVKEFPEFIYNYKSLSVIHALAETVSIPGIFKDIFGIRGSVQLGLAEITKTIEYQNENPFLFDLESDAIYAFILFYQSNEKEKAIDYLNKSKLSDSQSPLAHFVRAKLNQRDGKNDESIQILEELTDQYSVQEFPFIYFMLGNSLLRKLDPGATSYFQQFVSHFHGQHYLKEAYQKLAWAELIFDNEIPQYKSYMLLCKEKGNALIDDDKQALREADSKVIPNSLLLKARLLFDGGYYQKAHNLLVKFAHEFYFHEESSIEYFYRLGRINQELKNYHEAIEYFDKTIDNDKRGENYMSCNAALQLGIIYELQRDIFTAKKYFKQCIKMSPDRYKNSLHQKAKAGLSRIDG